MMKMINTYLANLKNMDTNTLIYTAVGLLVFIIIGIIIKPKKKSSKEISEKVEVVEDVIKEESAETIAKRKAGTKKGLANHSVKVTVRTEGLAADLDEPLPESLPESLPDTLPEFGDIPKDFEVMKIDGDTKERGIKSIINVLNEGIFNLENQQMEIFINTHIKIDEISAFKENVTKLYGVEPMNYITIQEFSKWLHDIGLDMYSNEEIQATIIPKVKKFREFMLKALSNKADFKF